MQSLNFAHHYIMGHDFKIIETEITGNVEITVNSQINNLNADTVLVAEDVKARLYGIINTKLILKHGAKVILHGTIFGDVQNEGGELSLFEKEK